MQDFIFTIKTENFRGEFNNILCVQILLMKVVHIIPRYTTVQPVDKI